MHSASTLAVLPNLIVSLLCLLHDLWIMKALATTKVQPPPALSHIRFAKRLCNVKLKQDLWSLDA